MNAINKNEVSMFKVGDKVVAISSELHGGIRDVQEIVNDTWIMFKHHGFHKSLFRHATPEEIAAGHRIDLETHATVTPVRIARSLMKG